METKNVKNQVEEQTPFTFPAQYAKFRKVLAEQGRLQRDTNDYASARHLGVYRDNMSVLHMALIKAGGEEWAKHFVDNIEDVYDEGYKQSCIDSALKMKADGMADALIEKYIGISIKELM